MVAYETGCMGLELQWLLTSLGVKCSVIAPGEICRGHPRIELRRIGVMHARLEGCGPRGRWSPFAFLPRKRKPPEITFGRVRT